MIDGIIEVDSEFGEQIGFVRDRFSGWLWKTDDYIYISFIESKKRGQGNLKALFDNILKQEYGIKVPTPMGLMQRIVQKQGFKQTEEDRGGEYVEVWVKEKTNEMENNLCD